MSGTEGPIPALSLHQPWASLVILGYKAIETRDWPPPPGIIGSRLAIHATQTLTDHRIEDAPSEEWRRIIAAYNRELEECLGTDWRRELPRGAMLGTVKLAGRRRVETSSDLPESRRELLFGEYGTGRWLWLLEDPVPFDTPIRTRGNRKVWWWTPTRDLIETTGVDANRPALF